jgi:hypothetical protein
MWHQPVGQVLLGVAQPHRQDLLLPLTHAHGGRKVRAGRLAHFRQNPARETRTFPSWRPAVAIGAKVAA